MLAVRMTDGTYSMWITVKVSTTDGTFVAKQVTSLLNRSTSIPRVASPFTAQGGPTARGTSYFRKLWNRGKGGLYF
jgi:hypothetical protein